MQADLIFAENVLKKSSVEHKYMRIRYEDIALNSTGNTLKIYNFIGINMTIKVKEWLDKATSITSINNLSVASPQGLRRNVKTVLNSWRKELSFKAVTRNLTAMRK